MTLADVGGSEAKLRIPFRGFDPKVKTVAVGVRPEHVRPGTGGADELPVVVSFAEELGDVTYIHGKLPAGSPLTIRSDGMRHDGSDACRVALDPAGLLLFDADGRRLRENGA